MATTIDGPVADAVAHACGGRAPGRIEVLGEGQDHVAVLVDGELVVRVAKGGTEAVRREVALLAVLGTRVAVAVPEVVWADLDAGALAYRVLPGTPLLGRPVGDARAVGTALGGLVATVAGLPLDDVLAPDVQPLRTWRDEAAHHYAQVRGELAPAGRALVERFLTEPLPRAPRVLVPCHDDLHAEHVLADADGSCVTGIIDWADAAMADVAHDIGLVWGDLGDLVTVHLVCALGRAWTADDAARATFYARCALLEDLAWGLAHDRARHVANARANLARVFA